MDKIFSQRHIGPNQSDIQRMLETLHVSTLDDLISSTIPHSIRLSDRLQLSSPKTEPEYLNHIQEQLNKNNIFRTYIGQGYYGTHTPTVIQRNIFENPSWYTQYTPYQAEISQGRLEALLNFQTLVTELTALPVANASLLDEATAAAEAMTMAYKQYGNAKKTVFLVDRFCFEQTKSVLLTRAEPMGITIRIIDHFDKIDTTEVFGCIYQYPNAQGEITVPRQHIHQVKQDNGAILVSADLLSLTLLEAPGTWGADIVVGSTQRFGVPIGFGGPHAAYLACKTEHQRLIPGRIIGVSKDAKGKRALRMALQTREQHIRKDKATSNICTAQALLAIIAGMYAVYHGPSGLQAIATHIHQLTHYFAAGITKLGYHIINSTYFDTLTLDTSVDQQAEIQNIMLNHHINLRYDLIGTVGLSFDETTSKSDIDDLLSLFPKYPADEMSSSSKTPIINSRTTPFLTQPTFNSYHSETQLLRYIHSLANKDLSLTHSMIPLGSCTMKLNATSEMAPLSFTSAANIHPFVPEDQVEGYIQIIQSLEKDLAHMTGFVATCLQPNSGAQGEYAGLLTIRRYYEHHNQAHRKIALIPESAHGTNPASAVMAGFKVISISCHLSGEIDLDHLNHILDQHGPNVGVMMITYPSTFGVFESQVRDVCHRIHKYGAQVYMDGANMNAQVGLTNPAMIGADICHLNLHKTFSIPHGGGGPGMGPICAAAHLAPFLPDYPDGAIAATPYSSASILLISYGYIKMMGAIGLTHATKVAILNANYIKHRLKDHYKCLFTGEKGFVAHELIIDIRPFKKSANITAEDVAKRLMDYGFHAPTLSWPVPNTLMIEPTESEDLNEMNRFCDALINIRKEIELIASGVYPVDNNPLKNAPHTQIDCIDDQWNRPYSRKVAFSPLPFVFEHKFWPSVNRINQALGDRNLVCTCDTIDAYESVL
jgi:glycine dehydrogenase